MNAAFPLVRIDHEAMATVFAIAIAGAPAAYARAAASAAFREIDRLEAELSRFVESSDIARLNQLRPGESTVIGEDTCECLVSAVDVSLATDRAFDAAYGSVRGDGPLGAPLFTIDPAARRLTSRAEKLHLDLGAIAKGYALDRAAVVLRDWDVQAACLHAGGSTVLAMGALPGQRGWPVGFGDPADQQDGIGLSLKEAALSASGTAIKGAHIIDPRTGIPATRDGRTWALAETGTYSDALSTAFFVMSDAEIAAFCQRHPQCGARVARRGQAPAAFGALARLPDAAP